MTTDGIGERDWTAGHDGPALGERDSADAEEVATEMHRNAERIRRSELEQALCKLDAHGTVSDAQRDAIEELTDAIVDRLLAAPMTRLQGENGCPPEAVVRLLELDTDTEHDDQLHGYGSYCQEVTGGDD